MHWNFWCIRIFDILEFLIHQNFWCMGNSDILRFWCIVISNPSECTGISDISELLEFQCIRISEYQNIQCIGILDALEFPTYQIFSCIRISDIWILMYQNYQNSDTLEFSMYQNHWNSKLSEFLMVWFPTYWNSWSIRIIRILLYQNSWCIRMFNVLELPGYQNSYIMESWCIRISDILKFQCIGIQLY